jgi:hypothetical protein
MSARRPVPVTCLTSRVNGSVMSAPLWLGLDFAHAWIDGGPSPAGNAGPYLQVPFALEPDFPVREGFIYRVYPAPRLGHRRPVRDAGSATGWSWEPVP